MIKLHNVIDLRTGQFHSVAIVKESHAKYFTDGEGKPIADVTDKAEAFDILMGVENV